MRIRFDLGMLLILASPLGAQDRPVAITGGTVVDLDGGPHIENAVVVLRDGRIAAVGPATTTHVPDGAEIIDATGLWLTPGLMNMHVHLGLKLPGAAGAALVNETRAELALRMAANAIASLRAGVTTIRIPGDEGHVDLALKRAIDRGDLQGPRIYSSGQMVQVTGGHGSAVDEIANDGPYEFRRAVRREIRAGATWIKLAISGGIATQGGDIAASFMTRDELEAVTDVAHRHGVKVTAHSGSPEATREAVAAGIDGIEHGYFLTRAEFELMRDSGVWYVPTIVVSQPATMPFFERIGSPEWYLDRVRAVGERHWDALRAAISVGVDIALGTDQFPHEENDGTIATVREAEYYVAAGMTDLQALRAATIEPARMLGADDELGSIGVGKLADLIGVAGDPSLDISALRDIRLVIKGGEVVR